MSGHEKFEVADVQAVRETEAALLVVIENEDVWVPKSLIDDDSEVWKTGDKGILVVPEWFARKNGLM